jgi:hypothetical protein
MPAVGDDLMLWVLPKRLADDIAEAEATPTYLQLSELMFTSGGSPIGPSLRMSR